MGMLLGPVLGGILYDKMGYYAALGLAFGLIGMDLVLRLILVEKKTAVRYTSPGTAEVILNQENKGNVKPLDLDLTAAEQPPLEIEPPVTVQSTSRIPTVIRILRFPRLLVALSLSFVEAVIFSALDATLPLHLNQLFNFVSLQAGTNTLLAH